jgi:hypothetical protein
MIRVTIDETSTKFNIEPPLSDERLVELLALEIELAHRAIIAAYPQIAEADITDDKLYLQGDWYAAALAPSGSATDTHYVILHKFDENWQIVAKPSLYFTYADHPGVPREVIEDVNYGIEAYEVD